MVAHNRLNGATAEGPLKKNPGQLSWISSVKHEIKKSTYNKTIDVGGDLLDSSGHFSQ